MVVGAAINTAFPRQVAALAPLSALSAVVLIALICGSVVAQNAAAVLQAGPRLLAAIFVLHAGECAERRVARMCCGAEASDGTIQSAVPPGAHLTLTLCMPCIPWHTRRRLLLWLRPLKGAGHP